MIQGKPKKCADKAKAALILFYDSVTGPAALYQSAPRKISLNDTDCSRRDPGF